MKSRRFCFFFSFRISLLFLDVSVLHFLYVGNSQIMKKIRYPTFRHLILFLHTYLWQLIRL